MSDDTEPKITAAQLKALQSLPPDGSPKMVTEAEAFMLRTMPRLASVGMQAWRHRQPYALAYDTDAPLYWACLLAGGCEWVEAFKEPPVALNARAGAQKEGGA